MIVFRDGKWLCRVLSTQRFSWRNVRIFRRENWLLLTSSGVILIWIMETLWIHCHVRKLLRKNELCNQYIVNKRRPVVQRPSRLKSKNSRTPAGWPSQRGTHLSNFDDSSILWRRVGVAENFERCEDFWKVTVRGPCPVGPSLCPKAEPIEKWHFEDPDRMPISTWHSSQ